ncbi:MAG: hypothetical protein AAF734_06720 [Bacteroidota bacterium]
MSENVNNESAKTASASEAKNVALISYLFLLGWIIAYVMHQGKPSSFGAYHLRQAFGAHLLGFVTSFLAFLPYVNYISGLISIAYIVLIVIGAMAANKEERKPLPVIGSFAESNFDFIKEN